MTSQKHGAHFYTTGDPCLDLLAAVYRQAIAEARRGDPHALAWLQVVAPDVAETLHCDNDQPHRKAAIARKRGRWHKMTWAG